MHVPFCIEGGFQVCKTDQVKRHKYTTLVMPAPDFELNQKIKWIDVWTEEWKCDESNIVKC